MERTEKRFVTADVCVKEGYIMADLSISSIISAGRKSLEDKNYWSALIVALSLPSMCSRIEYKGEEHKGENRNDENGLWYCLNNGIVRWHDKKAYIKWCNEWVSLGTRTAYGDRLIQNDYVKDSFLVAIIGDDYAEKLYEMRCNILHEAETDIEHGTGLPIFFSIGISNTRLSKEYIVEIESLCNAIFDYAQNWVEFRHPYDLPKRKYYDGNNEDDRLLYNGLREESRKEYLIEQHKKELERRNNS